jgi:hypothetical protein
MGCRDAYMRLYGIFTLGLGIETHICVSTIVTQFLPSALWLLPYFRYIRLPLLLSTLFRVRHIANHPVV